ncbi:MAG: zinc ribbon domain-containing protein [Humidesulfovibrio sp.]
MILCTSCGTKNADDAHTCAKCGRKLQSRWSRGGGQDGANGEGGKGEGSLLPEPVWQVIEPIVHGIEEGSDQLVKACAETWAYALILIAGAGVYIASEDWRYLAGSIALAAVLAWARGI